MAEKSAMKVRKFSYQVQDEGVYFGCLFQGKICWKRLVRRYGDCLEQ